jgi:hypothetical protein
MRQVLVPQGTDAQFDARLIDATHFGVGARPSRVVFPTTCFLEVPHHVALGIKDANRGHRLSAAALLSECSRAQILWRHRGTYCKGSEAAIVTSALLQRLPKLI